MAVLLSSVIFIIGEYIGEEKVLILKSIKQFFDSLFSIDGSVYIPSWNYPSS